MRKENKLIAAADRLSFVVLLSLLLTGLVACGGGGGGGGGGSTERRTTQTGLRIIHASVDGTPLEAVSEGISIQTARFAELTQYAPLKRGEQIITIQRPDTPSVSLSQIPVTVESKTEYTVFVSGETRRGSTNVTLFSDPIKRPASGFASVQLYHGYEGGGPLTLRAQSATGGVLSVGTAENGSRSELVELEAGPYTFTVVNSRGGQVGSITAELEEQSEAAILITGSTRLDLAFTLMYVDFD